jgi:hypothetical protein
MDNPTVLFVMGAMLIVFVLVRRSRKRGHLAKMSSVSPPPHVAHPPAGHHLDAPGAMGRWEVEMYELARDLAGQLDSKLVIVQQLVRNAEQATARLEALIERAEQVGLWQRNSGQPDDENVEDFQSATEPIQAAPVRDWPNPAEPDAPQPDWSGHAAASASATAALVKRTERAYQLADSGLTIAQIAAELGEPLGEVELILSVRTSERAK